MKLRTTMILLAVALLSAGYMLATSSIMTAFSGHDRFVGMVIPSGTFSCPGGEPTGVLFPAPCTPGSRFHNRDSKFQYYLDSMPEDRMTGPMELVSNGNYDGWRPDLMGPGSGQMWGTMRVTVEGHSDEVWEGTWTGTRTVTGTVVVITTHNVLFGTGGRIQGLKAEFTGTADPAVGGAYQGWILAPPGKSGK